MMPTGPERRSRPLHGPGLAVVIVGGLLAACLPVGLSDGEVATAPPALPASTPMALPSPLVHGSVSLEEALASRRSVREFAEGDVTLAQLGQLLWAAQGETGAAGGRTAPSAGALYPLELFVTGATGTYRYLPVGHALEPMDASDLRSDLADAAGQSVVGAGAVAIVVVGVPARSAAKYGERAERYVQLEAGHATQNLLLEVVALDLGAVTVGAFDDAAVSRILRLPAGWQPIYLLPVGHPA